MRPFLLVIDMLNDFCVGLEAGRCAERVGAIDALVSAFCSSGFSVVWVRQEFEPDWREAFLEMRNQGIYINIKGTWGCRIISELAPGESEPVIVKKRYRAFFGTDLDGVLDRAKPDAIVLAGMHMHACIRTTAIDAYQRDWRVVPASDCWTPTTGSTTKGR